MWEQQAVGGELERVHVGEVVHGESDRPFLVARPYEDTPVELHVFVLQRVRVEVAVDYTGFTVDDQKKNFSLKYEVNGKERGINYKINDNNTVTFVYIDDRGGQTTEMPSGSR